MAVCLHPMTGEKVHLVLILSESEHRITQTNFCKCGQFINCFQVFKLFLLPFPILLIFCFPFQRKY